MRVGPYQVLLELASGGMGKVYLARTLGPGGVERLVAIKRAHEHLLRTSEAISERFLDEARIAAHVHHSNVVGVHQAGSDEEGYYLVLDYVEGESLNGLVRAAGLRDRRLPLAIVLRIACDALAGLHAAHEATDTEGQLLGILHRDVSTQNLLVGRDGVTRLSDFGVAKSALSRVVTDENYVQGKLVYMSPEYLRRERVDRTLDIYAMGITLWIALAGESPWSGAEEAQLLHAILIRGVPPLRSVAPDVDPELAALVDRACHLEAAQRFQTAREMLDALEAVGAKLGGVARHVEVAECVEALVGPELAERRALVKRLRDSLDNDEDGPQSSMAPKSSSGPSSEEPGRAGGLAVDTRVPTELGRRTPKGIRPWLGAVSVAVTASASIALILALQRGSSRTELPPSHAMRSAPPPAAASPALESPPPAPELDAEPPTTTAAPSSRAPAAVPIERRAAPRRPQKNRRNTNAQSAATTPPSAAPFSSVNPYRAR